MDQFTHDVRTAHWAEIVRKCHERPENQTAKEWLEENVTNEKRYYYWQRKIIILGSDSVKKK
jgi:transposase